ncbi:MAG: hypothetical protein AAGF20_07145 [Pseudomonadota bacterium]
MSLNVLREAYLSNIDQSALWSAIGFIAAILSGLAALVLIVVLVARNLRPFLSKFGLKPKPAVGHHIAVARLQGPKAKAATDALFSALEAELPVFTFGAPFTLNLAPAPKATTHRDRADRARDWMALREVDLMAWGESGGEARGVYALTVLSRPGGLPAHKALRQRLEVPLSLLQGRAIVAKVAAYVFARTLQPGLAEARAFRPEKLEPVADILSEALSETDLFNAVMLDILEADYCAMALRIGTPAHLQRLVGLRQARLLADETSDISTKIMARADLGRAMIALSEAQFDPARTREGMDHLKAALDLLRADQGIHLATELSDAVRKGQALLSRPGRFSVTGGSAL